MRAIVALDLANGIGRDGQLLQTVSADLKRFKAFTTGGIVIYGRKTLETFPGQKGLPGRINIILTGGNKAPDGVIIAHDFDMLDRILQRYRKKGYRSDRVFVIGGESVYRSLLPRCEEILVTRFLTTIPADRFFPDLSSDPDFVLAEQSETFSEGDRHYHFETWRRVAKQLSLCEATRADRQAVVRFDLDLLSDGSTKERRSVLDDWSKSFGRKLFSLRDGDHLIGALYTDESAFSGNTLNVRFQLRRALRNEDLQIVLESLFHTCTRSFNAILSLPSLRYIDDGQDVPGLFRLDLSGDVGGQILFWAKRSFFVKRLVAFYPLPPGLFTFYSDGRTIGGAAFLLEGKKVADPVLADQLENLGLIDAVGNVKAKNLKTPVTIGFAKGADLLVQDAFDWLDAYFDGKQLPLPPLEAADLTAFQLAVRQKLLTILPGETVTYEELAELVVGPERAPRYARAVGQACGANPLPLFIPCHRVIGKGGELVGFSGGISVKDYLLNHELSMRLRNIDR